MSLWDAVEFLNTLIDDSDPDIELDQLQHCCKPLRQLDLTVILIGLSYWISA